MDFVYSSHRAATIYSRARVGQMSVPPPFAEPSEVHAGTDAGELVIA
jgi:hypothetical protein